MRLQSQSASQSTRNTVDQDIAMGKLERRREAGHGIQGSLEDLAAMPLQRQ